MSIKDDKCFWHKKLGHASLKLISKLKKHNLVRGFPKLFCKDNGILHNIFASRMPQQNSVVKIKNRSLQEMAKTMLNDHSTPKHF
ncbi:hypothetical protein CR513_10326, partial [Mucuna pruriens]